MSQDVKKAAKLSLKETAKKYFKGAARAAVVVVKAAAFPLWWNKKAVTLLLCSTFLTPFVSYLYPTAEEKLQQEGIRPEVLQELAPGKRIRVEEGMAAALMKRTPLPLLPFDGPPIVPINLLLACISPNAYAMRTGGIRNLSGNNIVNMQTSRSFDLKDWLLYDNLQPGEIKNTPLSKKEMDTFVLLHEIRHCGQSDTLSDMEQEGDADFCAVTVAAREFKNPEIIKCVFNWRAASVPSGEAHDVALYLEARLHGQPIPSTEQMKKACKEAQSFIDDEENRVKVSSLSGLAQHRLALWKQARDYFQTPASQKKPVGPRVF
ncbi:MAG: hypothetical protein HY052_05505 [Proteobacteria bacterium]|nr:hypothetical protein [Pseudomonadota bacterium]